MVEVKAYDRPHNEVPSEVLRVLVCRWCREGLQAIPGHRLVFASGFKEGYGGGEEPGPFWIRVGDGWWRFLSIAGCELGAGCY
jgi:hypothetical protein